jgi:hypothetical protein
VHPSLLVADGAVNLLSPLALQDAVMRTTIKSRLRDPLPASIDEAATKIVSHNATLTLPSVDVNADVDADPITDMYSNARGTRALYRWTLGEDAKLTSAATNTSKKKRTKEYRTDWAAVTALVPSRTEVKCRGRWHDVLERLSHITIESESDKLTTAITITII